MKCPHCNTEGSVVVVETRHTAAGLRRRRRCDACGKKFSTVEQVVPDRSNYNEPMAMVPRRELEQISERIEALLPGTDKEVA